MLDPFIIFLATVLQLYSYAVVVYIIINLLFYFNIINRYNDIVIKVQTFLARLIEPLLGRIRRFLPDLGGIDLSPLVLILLLELARNILFHYFMGL
jgi:YggT family protein